MKFWTVISNKRPQFVLTERSAGQHQAALVCKSDRQFSLQENPRHQYKNPSVAQITHLAIAKAMSQKLQSQYICIAVTAVRTQGTSFQQQSYLFYYTLWTGSLPSESQQLWHTKQLGFVLYIHYYVYFHHKQFKQIKKPEQLIRFVKFSQIFLLKNEK